MKFGGYNQDQIRKITEIFGKYKVNYEVSVQGDQLLEINIQKEELVKIPKTEHSKLFELGIDLQEELVVTELDKKIQIETLYKLRAGHLWIKLAVAIAILILIWKLGFYGQI